MMLTVLSDNNTYIGQYCLGEPGLCFYLEDGEERILFDLGYSDVFIRNANAMGIHLDTVFPCHCTSLFAKLRLSRLLRLREVGVGLQLEWDEMGNLTREIHVNPVPDTY